jgi:predicted metalloprotease with PDZ domain
MRKLLFFFLPMLLIACKPSVKTDVSLAYILEIKPDIMHVNMNYIPVVADSTTFQYGNVFYGGMKDLLKSMVNIHSSVKLRIDSVRSCITFYHPGNSSVRISYDIIDTHKPEQRVVGEMFRPIITRDYFFSLSHTLFLNPDIKENRKDSIFMSVTLKSGSAFPMYFSFAPELQPGETAIINLTKGMDALVTGASDLHIEKRKMSGIMNYVVLRINKKNGYNLSRFMTYFDTYLPAMTNFWGNLNGTYYSLVASPFLDIDYHLISGTAFNQGFHVKYSGDTILANEEVICTISHEIMHRYIGSGSVAMNEDNQWFNEGFTDYSTWYLLSHCSILPADRLKEKVEETYKELSVNTVRNTPNEDVMKHFWENKDYEKLPYYRGALFAAYLDKRIKELGNNTCNYCDFMRSLKAMAEQKKKKLTVDDFIIAASKYIPEEEIRNSVNRYIMKGEMIPRKIIFN